MYFDSTLCVSLIFLKFLLNTVFYTLDNRYQTKHTIALYQTIRHTNSHTLSTLLDHATLPVQKRA